MAKDNLFDKFIKWIGVGNDGSAITNALGAFLNKPKKFTPSDPGYNDSMAVGTTPQQAKYLLDKMTGIPEARRAEPPGYWDYIEYPHRREFDQYHLRIGDCCLVIPPEFISVKTLSSTDSKVGIRQSSTVKTKHGYARREIVVTLYFNGVEQINGYKVSSPMDYPYYVDGLRPLLAQFKCTPFLPVENEFLNATCGIFNVALSSISVSTVPGFPECLQGTLVMQEFNATPYIETDNMFFDYFFDWDLFRYYYQQMLRNGIDHPSKLIAIPDGTLSLTGKFDFLALKPEVLNGDKNTNQDNLFASDNFVSYVNTNDNIELTELNFGLSNILPVLQLSDHSNPTMQYLGGTDTVFSLIFETTDRDVVAKFTDLNIRTQLLVRTHRDYNGLGYVKINNELVNLTGTKFLMIDNITVNTVPEFPDLFNIQVECVSYDHTQKDRENLFGIRPFPADTMGKVEDALSQDWQGVYNKIIQDVNVEEKLTEFDLYPDLRLPSFSEVNEAVTKIKAFRTKNQLQQIGYDKYPKGTCDLPKHGPGRESGKYVDPDFYMFYPLKYADIEDDAFETVRGFKAPTASSVTKPAQDYGDELPDSEKAYVDKDGNIIWRDDWEEENNISDEGGVPTTVSGNGSTFVEILTKRVGDGYCWGADGQTLTESKLNELIRRFGASHYDGVRKWMGKTVYDCSGFISWGLREIGVAKAGYREVVGGIYRDHCTSISRSELQPGDLCFSSGHIACYIGNDKTVEAMNTNKGVVIGNVGNRFTYYGRIKGLSNAEATRSNSNSSSNSSSSNDEDYVMNTAKMNQYRKERAEKLDKALGGVLKGHGMTYVQCGVKYGIDAELVAAIAMQETGNGTSPAVRNHNNPGGIMDWDNNWKTIRHFSTLDEGIDFTFRNLKKLYFDKGLNTIEKIGAKYAPIGAKNDPNNLNRYWVPNVTSFYNKIKSGTGNGVGYEGSPSTTTPTFPKSEYQWTNEGAGTVYGNKVGTLNAENFGKPLYLKSPVNKDTWDKGGFDSAQEAFKVSEEDLINRMSVDMVTYNSRGRMLRAYPTYMMLIADDSGEWLDARKLWSNYYAYKSVVDISVHQEDAQPAHTAVIRVTNVYQNLTRAPKDNDTKYSIEQDPEYNGFKKWYYKKTGALLGTPKLTKSMVEVKNQLYENIELKTGCRIHIRMGYGNNALNLPISFNGIVTEMDSSDIITLVAQSDGLELINEPISSKPKQTNKVTNLQSEPSDIVASLLTDRDNWFLYTLNKKWGEKNKYGIEHFGQPMGEGVTDKHKEYDLCKNVYYGKYKWAPYCTKQGIFNFDGEDNINFYLYNRTPWDIMQMTAQFLPEFVCQPMYHQFESRVFYGLPTWTAKYKYDVKDGTIYEYGKSFAQFHYIDSLSDIIDNQIRTSSKDLNTNCIAMYSLGGDMKSSPTCYSDKSIDWSKQRTKVIDSTVVQDYVGWDWLYEHMGGAVGKAAAIKIAISNLIDSWESTYKGELIILGDASIKPCDYIGMNDTHAKMSGLCLCREVVHSLNAESGFITSITPGLIATSTMQNSGANNANRSMISLFGGMAATRVLRVTSLQTLVHLGKLPGMAKTIAAAEKIGVFSKNAVGVSKVMYNGLKTGKAVKDFKAFTTEIKTTATLVKSTKNLGQVVTAIKTGGTVTGTLAGGPIGTAVSWLVTTVLFDMLLTAIIDAFAYNNCITIHPLIYKDTIFTAGTKGNAKLVPGFADSGADYKVREDEADEDD